jgi:tRNA(Glu) U13 pseudouridine synthase TruD
MDSNNENLELDEWELKLQLKKQELQRCQENKKVDSCLKCIELLNCELRDSYVHAVYSSMNKGAGGGFEF